MKHKTILVILALFLSLTALSRPAGKGTVFLRQPDGTIVEARIRGDEFSRITTTTEGNALVQDKDGWWCYAIFDEEGGRGSSGWKAGHTAPDKVLSRSRAIPYDLITGNAIRKRSEAPSYEKDFISRLGPQTRDGAETVKHGIIILAQYSDVKFRHSRQDFIDLLTKEGYSRNGATGSAKEYFDDQFGGMIDFRFDVSEIVTLPGTRAEYGSNLNDGTDKDPARMVIEACQAVDAGIDFSIYDDDNDGEIDNVFIFFAGGDEAEGAGEECIWSHSWYIFNGAGQSVLLDGKMLDSYACCSELSRRYESWSYEDMLTGIGTFCHEYSHTFGLPDLYDTDYEESGGNSAGVWIWTSLMDGGNQNNNGNTPPNYNAIEKEILGITVPTAITRDGTYFIGPSGTTDTVYKIESDREDEYYLMEFRDSKGWDSHIGGKGMLVYHIDRSKGNSGYSDLYGRDMKASERWVSANEVNCRPDHQCADLLEADGRKDGFAVADSPEFSSLYSDISNVFYPQGDVDAITPDSNPGFRFWSGIAGTVSVEDIRWKEGGIEFKVRNIAGIDTPPEAVNIRTEAFPDAAIIRFESSQLSECEAVIEWGLYGSSKESVRIKAYEPGKYALLLEGLIPDNKTYEASICFESDGIRGDVRKVSFMTKKAASVGWPYIYINGVERRGNGSFAAGSALPLRVINAADAAEINWTFNGNTVTTDGDFYYRVTENGTLKAHIIWEDGSEETIMKEIIIERED